MLKLCDRRRAQRVLAIAVVLVLPAIPVHARDGIEMPASTGFAAGAPGLPASAAAPSSPQPPAVIVNPVQRNDNWSAAEIAAARSQCHGLLKKLNAKYTFLDPVRRGACGSAAPIELSAIGVEAAVAISPPITVTCDTAVALDTWLRQKTQPLAKQHMKTRIAQINTMSSYACRNRYGRAKAPLSQHAFARAIDIRGFVTTKGELIDVQLHWGPTTKELAAHEAQMEKLRQTQAMQRQPKAPAVAGAQTVKSNSGWMTTVTSPVVAVAPTAHNTSTMTTGSVEKTDLQLRASFPVMPVSIPRHALLIRDERTGKLAQVGAAPVEPGRPLDGRAHFLRAIHDGGCGIFGTVLGPEFDRRHRDHLHVDTAERRNGAYCR